VTTEMKQPLPSDYDLTDSGIEQIRSTLRHNEILKSRCEHTILIVSYIVTVALTWSRFGLASFIVGFLGICILGFIFGIPISLLIDKYLDKKVLRIKGASSLKEFEHQLEQRQGVKSAYGLTSPCCSVSSMILLFIS
jgi:hypothetical protein